MLPKLIKRASGGPALEVGAIRVAGATSGQVLTHDGTEFVPGAAPSAGVDPFLFRLDVTTTSQFGAARTAGVGVPTVATGTDASTGRNYLRFTTMNGDPSFIPFAGVVGTGRFLVELRARWDGAPSGCMLGVGFNADAAAGADCYAVTNRSSDGKYYDSIDGGAAENFQAANQRSIDGSYDWPSLFVDVWIDLGKAVVHYAYGPLPDGVSFGAGYQRRKSALATGGSEVGLYGTGGAGYLDVAELTIWRPPAAW